MERIKYIHIGFIVYYFVFQNMESFSFLGKSDCRISATSVVLEQTLGDITGHKDTQIRLIVPYVPQSYIHIYATLCRDT